MIPGPISTLRGLDDLRAQATILDNGYHRWPPPYQLMSIALEEAELLYALVRATRPRNVLELGTGLGISARFIGQGLQDNGDGHLLTVEPLDNIADQARVFLEGLPATVVASLDDLTFDEPHLVYIDSGYDYRPADIAFWLRGPYKGLVVVHDADRDYVEIAELGVGVTVGTANGMWIGKAK